MRVYPSEAARITGERSAGQRSCEPAVLFGDDYGDYPQHCDGLTGDPKTDAIVLLEEAEDDNSRVFGCVETWLHELKEQNARSQA